MNIIRATQVGTSDGDAPFLNMSTLRMVDLPRSVILMQTFARSGPCVADAPSFASSTTSAI